VVVSGIARNAKAGAVVRLDTSAVLYLMGLDEWPDHVLGKRVKVSGVIGRAKLAPDPVVGKDGSHSAGMVGRSTVIRQPKWELMPAP